MEKINSELTKKEQDILEKRGFYVKNNITFYNMVMSFGGLILSHSIGGFYVAAIIFIIAGFIWTLINELYPIDPKFHLFQTSEFWITVFCISQIPVIFRMIKLFINYVFLGKKFYGSFNNIYQSNGFLGTIIQSSFKWFNKDTKRKDNILVQIGLIPSILLSGLVVVSIFYIPNIKIGGFYCDDIKKICDYGYRSIIEYNSVNYLFYLFIVILSFYGGGFILRQLVEIFHPLYAFGNIGENIQKITPQIGVQSKLIEEGFKKDMNFRILHAGFEKLSSTFSQIISLVVRLEKAEKRAKRGNIFDSEKYINSLRLNIVTPLTTLKAFLEKQRDELIASREELTTVRVKVGGEKGEGNLDLASKRNDSLLGELERNIKALDRMIGKLG